MNKKINHRSKTELHRVSGFTMVEIIVVILIVSILVSTAIPSFLTIINKVGCRAEINLINMEVERKENISGKIKGCEFFLRQSYALNFYVHASGKTSYQYYYFPIKVNAKDWESSVIFGDEQDSGAVFKGGVVLTNPKDPEWSNYDADNGRNSLIGMIIGVHDFLRK
jgi:prepilin-type N-terminal cleavage/methylation domain-containing protein